MGLDPTEFRTVLGHYPTGIAVVAAISQTGEPIGMVVGSFTSVSLDPPLVAYMPQKNSKTYKVLGDATRFCINILSAEQEDLCRTFASRGATDKWAGVPWSPAPSGAPRLDEAVGWIDCVHEQTVEAGDHDIVIGRVDALGVLNSGLPLLFFQGGYGKFTSTSLVVRPEADLLGQIKKADVARPVLERLSAQLELNCGLQVAVGGDLVFIASAGPGDGRGLLRVGRRAPHVPPVGALFVAWAGDEAVTAWIDRLPEPPTDAQRAALQAGLARVRGRGYSIALQSPEFVSALAHLRAIDASAAEAEREMVRLMAGLDGLYEPIDLNPWEGRSVRLISAPVFDARRKVEIVVQLWDLPAISTVDDIERYTRALKEAAVSIETLLVEYSDSL